MPVPVIDHAEVRNIVRRNIYRPFGNDNPTWVARRDELNAEHEKRTSVGSPISRWKGSNPSVALPDIHSAVCRTELTEYRRLSTENNLLGQAYETTVHEQEFL